MNFIKLILLILVLIVCGCLGDNKWSVKTSVVQKKNLSASVSSFSISNDQLTISGSGFSNINNVKLTANGSEQSLNIVQISDTQIIARAKNALSVLVGSTLDLVVESAEAQATFPITFTLQDGAVSASKLSNMGASSGQVLKFNGTNWSPASLSSSQTYLGTWNASTNSPDISNLGSFQNGDYYIVNHAGTYSSVTYGVGDWAMFNGTAFEKIDNSSNTVSSFQTRRGAVVLVPGDYVSLKDTTTLKVTGSSINDFADIDLTTLAPTNGQILKYNSSSGKWIPSDDLTGGGAGSVTTSTIANGAVTYSKLGLSDGDIPQAKVNGLVSSLAGKEDAITSGTSLQYYRGDKTWQTLSTSAVTEGTRLYYTDSRAIAAPITTPTLTNSTIAASDTIQTALGKLQAQINSFLSATLTGISTSTNSIVTSADTLIVAFGKLQAQISGLLSSKADVTNSTQTITAAAVTGLTTPISGTDAANKNYVDTQVSGANNQWGTGSGNVYRTTGNVGIGTNNPTSMLQVNGTLNNLLLNGNYLQINDTNPHNYKIATLPVSSNSTYDHLRLMVTLNPNWYSTSNTMVDAFFANRNTFTYQYSLKGITPSGNARLTAYNNGGAIDIYLSFPGTNAYTNATYTILESQNATVYSTPSDAGATPAGTLVFDTSSSSYPPSSTTNFSGYLGLGTSSPAYQFQTIVNPTHATPSSVSITNNITGAAADPSLLFQRWSGTTNLYFGTSIDNSNGAFLFETTNAAAIGSQTFSPRMIITNAGNVGIGTTTPAYKLDVNGSINATSLYVGGSQFTPGVQSGTVATTGGQVQTITQSSTNAATGTRSALTLQNQGTGTTNEYNLVGLNESGSVTSYIRQDGTASFASYVFSPLYYGTSVSGGNLTLDSTSNSTKGKIILAPTGGNVGIGTSNPSALLEVSGAGAITKITGSGSVGVRTSSTSASARSFDFLSDGNNAFIYENNSATGQLILKNNLSATPVVFDFAAPSNSLFMTSAGNVGIGTSSPTTILDVAGTITSYSLSAKNGNTSTYSGTSSSSNLPSGPSLIATNTSTTDTSGSFHNFSVVNSNSTSQQAYIGAISTTGASVYTPSIVFGQRTGNPGYTERMRIDSSGNVGIGNSSPVSRLDVGFDNADNSIRVGYNSTNYIGLGFRAGSPYLEGVDSTSGNGGPLSIQPNGGNVGVGTTTPIFNLDVAGGIRSGAAPASLTSTSGSTTAAATTINVASTTGYPTNGVLYFSSTGELASYTGTTSTTFTGLTRGLFGTTAATINSGSIVDIAFMEASSSTTQLPRFIVTPGTGVAIGGAVPPSWLGNSGLYVAGQLTAGGNFISGTGYAFGDSTVRMGYGGSNSTGYLTMVTNSSERLRVDASGNVGVGTTAPAGPLHLTSSSWNKVTLETTGVTAMVRQGADANGMNFTTNALWNGSAWSRDDSTKSSFAFIEHLGNSRMEFRVAQAGSGTIGWNTAQVITDTGNVGIGTTSPSYTLHVNGSVAGTSAYNNLSDIRLKKNISVIPNSLEKLISLDGVFYHWRIDEFPEYKLSERREMGVVAQKVEKIFPEAITKNKDGFKSVAYSMLIAPIINSIKEIYFYYKDLTQKIKSIEESKVDLREFYTLKEENLKIKTENEKIKAENNKIKMRLDRIEKILEKQVLEQR